MTFSLFENPAENDPKLRPSTLNTKHYYNLQNQSWGIPRKGDSTTTVNVTVTNPETGLVTVETSTVATTILFDPIVKYFNDLSVYPSNSEAVWAGLQFQAVQVGEKPFEKLYTNLYEDVLGASTKAAKGYFIIDALRRGASRQSAYAQNKNANPALLSPSVPFPSDITSRGASVVTAFAGRVFYAGFGGEVVDGDSRSPNLANAILFSQVVKQKKDVVKCYSEGDPTSRENNEIVDTDGGFIKVAGASYIQQLHTFGTALLIFSTNGVWAIKGGSDFGFSATNYKVDKLTSFGIISRDSVVQAGEKLYYWGSDGIYVVSKNQFGDFVVGSVSEETIQTLYDNIPETTKETSQGIYDRTSKTIRWLYTSSEGTYELIFNTFLGAFTKNRIMDTPDGSVSVTGFFETARINNSDLTQAVVVGGAAVFVALDSVEIPEIGRVNGLQSLKYLTFIRNLEGEAYGMTFSYYRNPQFQDWPQLTPVDAEAFLITGEQIAGDSSVAKQIPYLTLHFTRTEAGVNSEGQPLNQSGCFVRSQWDWSNNSNSNKFSPFFQAYRYRKVLFSENSSIDPYDSGFKLVTSKNKLRGRGKAFSLHIKSEPLKDCILLGWNLSLNGNQIT